MDIALALLSILIIYVLCDWVKDGDGNTGGGGDMFDEGL